MQTIEHVESAAREEATGAVAAPAPGRTRRPPRAITRRDALTWLTAVMLVGAAAIHFGMMGEHAGISWTHRVFFATVAWVQILLAVAVVRRPDRTVAGAVAVANLAVLGVWIVSRTAGITIGGDGTPEAWGTIDGVCAALEGVAIVAALALFATRFVRRPLSAGTGWAFVAFMGLVVAALVGFVFSPAVTDGASADGHDHGHGTEATATGATATGADAAAAAPAGHVHGPTTLDGGAVKGVKAADIAAESEPDKPLDPATRATLKAQLVQARDVALKYPTVADATANGFHLAGGFAPGSGAHYVSYGGLSSPTDFDPTKVEALIYDGTSPSSQIIGLMYYAMSDQAPVGFAGPNDHWHRHSNVCIKGGPGGIEVPFPADAEVTKAQCDSVQGTLMKVTGWMVHAWVVPSWESPQGVFSHDNPNVRCADGTYETDKSGFCQGT